MEAVLQFLRMSPFAEYNVGIGFVALIFGIFWFVVYNVYVLWDINDIGKYHRTIEVLPVSISQTYYMIEVRWLFKMFMWSSVFALLCCGQNVCYLLSAICFGIMTCNPSVNGGNVYFIPHVIGAISGTVLALIGVGVTFGGWGIVLAAAVVIPIMWFVTRKEENVIYFVEMNSYILLFAGLLFGILAKLQ